MTLTHILIAAAAALLVWRVIYWYGQGKKLQKDGYLPPYPTFVGQWTLRVISKLMCRLFVGPVKVIGRENANFKGRLNILPNHQFPLDFMVMGRSLPSGFRHLGTASEMKGGVRGTLAAFAGFYAAHTDAGKIQGNTGDMIVDATARVLAQHKRARNLMFPQGTLVKDNVQRSEQYRTGAMRAIARACAEYGVSPDEIAALPVAILYLRDPRYASTMHKLLNKIGWKKFRSFRYDKQSTTNYGAIVVIGKPILASSLPADARDATEVVRVEIDKCLTQAKEWAAKRV